MLTDAITGGGAGGGGPKFIPAGGSILGWLVRNALVMWGFNTINSNFRRLIGTEPDTPQQAASRAVGDWVQGRYVISKTKQAYKSTVAAEEAARRLPALQRLSRTKKIAKITVAGTKLAARGVGLATASATSVATFGLSFAVEEALMNWVIDPIIDSAVSRYVRWTLKPYELPLYATIRDQHAKGGYKNVDPNIALHNMRLIEQAGGVSSKTWRGIKSTVRGWDYALFTDKTQAPEALYPDEVTPAQMEALTEKRNELDYWKKELEKGTPQAGRNVARVQNELYSLNKKINGQNYHGYKTLNEYLTEGYAKDYINNNKDQSLAMLRGIAGLGPSSDVYKELYEKTSYGEKEDFAKAAYLKNTGLGLYDKYKNEDKLKTREDFDKFIEETTGYHDRSWLNQTWHALLGDWSHITRKRPHKNPKNLKERAENYVWDLEFDHDSAYKTFNSANEEERQKLTAFAAINANRNLKTDEKQYKNAGASDGLATNLARYKRNDKDYNHGVDISKYDDNLDIVMDGGALDKAASDIAKAENVENVGESGKDVIVHKETTDLISAENQVAYRLGELTSILSGRDLVTQGQSGNEKAISPTGDISSSLTLGGNPGALHQYIAKLENLQTNYAGKMSDLHV